MTSSNGDAPLSTPQQDGPRSSLMKSFSSKTSFLRRKKLLNKFCEAAHKAYMEEDCWKKHNLQLIPAQRIIRHIYHPSTQSWTREQTICKIESEPFANGAMRQCYRMKKMAVGGDNTHFHSGGWDRAPNYVAKAYPTPEGEIDTSDVARKAVFDDIKLQYEAAYWADKFNEMDVPRKINFLKAYVIEFPDREGSPCFAVERFISGKDDFGAGFVKHNSNSGYIDTELERTTPQIFSAYSFYASRGTRLVADIQGVGDLFTDPQVHSIDERFGEGDLGVRGMALFFESFHHGTFADALGIPVFPLSRNEIKWQLNDLFDDEDEKDWEEQDDKEEVPINMNTEDRYLQLDLNRQKSRSLLFRDPSKPLVRQDTDTTSNLSKANSIRLSQPPTKPKWHRSKSDTDEVQLCLNLSMTTFRYDNTAFHRLESGELDNSSHEFDECIRKRIGRRPTIMRKVLNPMIPDSDTRANLAEVHYALACLHGQGRFPEVIPQSTTPTPDHDVYSVLFHLCHAASHNHALSCLSLSRVKSGCFTQVSNLLHTIVPIDFDGAKELLYRVLDLEEGRSGSKAAAACLLIQLLSNEENAEQNTASIESAIEEAIKYMIEEEEEKERQRQKDLNKPVAYSSSIYNQKYKVGDRVEANFAMEGTFYPATIIWEVVDGHVTVQYDDDGSTEKLTSENVKRILQQECPFKVGERVNANFAMEGTFYPAVITKVHKDRAMVQYDDDGSSESLSFDNIQKLENADKTATATDADPVNEDEAYSMEMYELKGKLADIKAQKKKYEVAAGLYEEASSLAMECGKMKTASEWSMKSMECASKV